VAPAEFANEPPAPGPAAPVVATAPVIATPPLLARDPTVPAPKTLARPAAPPRSSPEPAPAPAGALGAPEAPPPAPAAAAPVPSPRAELRSRPILPAREPAEPNHREPTGAPALPVEAGRGNGAVAERLIRALPVPVFPHRHVGDPAPSAVRAASLPVWQETSPARPAPRRAPWTPAAGGDLKLRPILVRALKLGCLGALGFVLLLATLIVLYRWVDPPRSMLMLGQRLGGTPITQHWLSLEHISSNLQLAVIASEDGRFCRHHGVDWEELESAIDQSVDGIARGGSTIAMQTVKNLFLWPAKSYLRKAIEIPLAYAVDATWSKRRLLEIYLNIAEWGPGIFGAEAASRYHFRKPASLLSPREAALLAVSLPNPFERRAGATGPGTQRLAANLMLRMRAAPGMARCVRSGTGL
jgi:monofunctional biosynthetic peptidoglycan transglycosylase